MPVRKLYALPARSGTKHRDGLQTESVHSSQTENAKLVPDTKVPVNNHITSDRLAEYRADCMSTFGLCV